MVKLLGYWDFPNNSNIFPVVFTIVEGPFPRVIAEWITQKLRPGDHLYGHMFKTVQHILIEFQRVGGEERSKNTHANTYPPSRPLI